MKDKIGIVILNFNGSNFIKLALDSINRAKTDVNFEVAVVDNGSTEVEEQKCREIFSAYCNGENKVKGFFISTKKNLGFSGGNNVAIKKFLEDPSVSHICLLNSDVIVTDYWLDYLTKDKLDVTGPVTNAAGNEQTVAINYSVNASTSAYEKINSFAQNRHNIYLNHSNQTDILYFFCVIIKREVIETIGLLDEQFFPGSYEDNDYCIRMLNAGYKLTVIRDCYLHHFGSGSFSKLNMPERVNISITNKQKFEEKWKTKCKDNSWKLSLSIRIDFNFFSGKEIDPWAASLLNDSMKNIENLIDNLENRQFLEKSSSEGINESYEVQNLFDTVNGTTLLKLSLKKAFIKALHLLHLSESFLIKNDEEENFEEDKLYKELLSQNTQLKRMICFFAPIFNKTNERDGYFQRVKAIDTDIFPDYFRIYLFDDESQIRKIKVQKVDNDKVFIIFNSHNKNHRRQIFTLVKECGIIYTHSLLRFLPTSVDQKMLEIFTFENVVRIWDVHGSVPEEFLLHNDSFSSKISTEIEKYLYYHTDIIITVTEAMKKHLEDKYGPSKAEVVELPIFSKSLLENHFSMNEINLEKNQKPIVVYAGGLQKWQNVELMQKIILQTIEHIEYRIFVPDPANFMKQFGIKSLPNIIVESKAPNELEKEYRNCHYGFVLRDDIAVNNVACPTKIIEYIQNGIVPILKTPNIGDFAKLGMEYISYTDLLDNKLPSEQDRQKMAKHNLLVLKSLGKMKKEGKQNIITSIKALQPINQKTLLKSPDVEINPNLPVIGLVVSQFDKGGLEQAVFNLYEGYRRYGYRTYILCQSNNVGYFAKKLNSPNDLFVFNNNPFRFILFCKQKNISWLHYHYNTFLIKFVKKIGIHTIYSIQNIYSWLSDTEMKERSELINTADHVVAGASFSKEYYCKRSNTPSSRVEVIPIGVNTKELDNTNLDKKFTRDSLGLNQNDIILGFIASFHQVKHQMNMIGAMEEIIKVNPQIKLIFVGNIGHQKYYQQVKDIWEKSPAKNNIIHIPFIDHSQLGEFLRKTIDIFILPTIQEGCSNAVIDALYCGKPMLLTNVGNASDLEHLKSVVVVERPYKDLYSFRQSDIDQICLEKKSRNNDEIVRGILKIADNLEQFRLAAEDAAKLYASQCDKSTMVERYINLIQDRSDE